MNASMYNGFALAAALSCAAAGALGQPYEYAVFELGNFGFQNSAGRGIGDQGAVVGVSDNGIQLRAFIWQQPGPMQDLGTLPGGSETAQAYAVNSWGWVAGYARDAHYNSRPVMWQEGTIADLAQNVPGNGGDAEDLNDAGTVVGQWHWEVAPGEHLWSAFSWSAGEMTILQPLETPANTAGAEAINEAGEIVGASGKADGPGAAVRWIDGEVFELAFYKTGYQTVARDINDVGQIVGEASGNFVETRALLWEHGGVRSIHGLGINSRACAINNAGEVVGWASLSDELLDDAAFRWTEMQGMIDLNSRIAPRGRYEVNMAEGINDWGQIAASGRTHGAFWINRALLLSPISPRMILDVGGGQLVSGRTNELIITGASPGRRVYFAYSETGGGSYIPGCTLQENALQLQNPTTLGSAVADANGVARLQRYIPRPALGRTLLLQAVVPGECAVSALIVETIE